MTNPLRDGIGRVDGRLLKNRSAALIESIVENCTALPEAPTRHSGQATEPVIWGRITLNIRKIKESRCKK